MPRRRRNEVINGLPVVNAKESIMIRISPNDIKRGKVKDPSSCAAALACKRELGCVEALVHVGRTYVRYNGKWERYLTSQPLRTEIVSFDRGGKFHPGEYKLIRMQPSRYYDKYRKRKTGPHTTKKRRTYHILSHVRPTGVYA